MKYLVLSDSHTRRSLLERIISSHSDCDAVIFCGDGASDIEKAKEAHPEIEFICVRGNCDMFSDLPEFYDFETEGVRVALLHGHNVGAKYGDGGLIQTAKDGRYSLVIHGHTHSPRADYFEGQTPFYLFNPGAVMNGSFGIAVIKDGQILLSHGRI